MFWSAEEDRQFGFSDRAENDWLLSFITGARSGAGL